LWEVVHDPDIQEWIDAAIEANGRTVDPESTLEQQHITADHLHVARHRDAFSTEHDVESAAYPPTKLLRGHLDGPNSQCDLEHRFRDDALDIRS
jgi:hypothetical protein